LVPIFCDCLIFTVLGLAASRRRARSPAARG
jgi:hypothetical protein